MTPSRRRAIADLSLGASAVMALATLVLLTAISDGPGDTPLQSAGDAAQWLTLILMAGAIASVVTRRQPDNRLSLWLSAGSVLGSFYALAEAYASWTLFVEPGVAPGGTVALLASSIGLFSSWAILGAHMTLRFPTGELLSPRWRWVAWLATASAVLCGIQIFHPAAFDDEEMFADLPNVSNPIGIPGFGPIASVAFGIGILTLFLTTFIGVASLVVRYRRSRGVERDQLRWVAFSSVMVTVVMLVSANLANAVGPPARGIFLGISTAMPPFLMAGLGMAILRHHLFDVRVVIRRAVLYGLLAGFITATYVAVVVGVGQLLGTRGSEDLRLSIAATALVAAGFQPVRERLERFANRLVYGDVTSPYDLMTGLSRRITETVSPEETLSELAAVTARGLRSQAVRVRLFLPDSVFDEVIWPEGFAGEATFPIKREVSYAGVAVGEIAVEPRKDDPPGDAELQMLDDLASHAGVALRNLRLTGQLQQKLVELRNSRQRLVEAQTEERRRMERDIHDGAQQQLVSIRIKLGLAKSLLTEDLPAAEEIIGEVQKESAEALETLRDLARGLFPPTLAERGLAAAVRAHFDKSGLAGIVEDGDLGSLRFDVSAEASVYFCIREALQNASKHAPGLPVTVSLSRDAHGRLIFSITDQGPGFDPATVVRGSGLQNMVDRIEALGGTLEFRSVPGHGTTVEGVVPIEVPDAVAASAG